MLGLVMIVIKRAVECICHETVAGLHNRFRTAHIPVLEAWNEIDIEIRFSIYHVHELVAWACHAFDSLGLKAVEDLIHQLLIFIVRATDNWTDWKIFLMLASYKGSNMRRNWTDIWDATVTATLLRCCFAWFDIVVINSEKTAFLKSDISAPDSWEIATVGIRLDEGFVNNSKERSFVQCNANDTSEMFSMTLGKPTGSIKRIYPKG